MSQVLCWQAELKSGLWPNTCAGDFPQKTSTWGFYWGGWSMVWQKEREREREQKKDKKHENSVGHLHRLVHKDRRHNSLEGGGSEKKARFRDERMCACHVSLNICLVNHMSFFHSLRLALSICLECPKALSSHTLWEKRLERLTSLSRRHSRAGNSYHHRRHTRKHCITQLVKIAHARVQTRNRAKCQSNPKTQSGRQLIHGLRSL